MNHWGPRLVVAVATALSLAGPALAVPLPGMRAAVTQKGLDYVVEVGIPLLKASLATTHIDDVTGSTSLAEYSVTGIQLRDFEIPHSSLTSGGEGVRLQSSDISMSLHADWRARTKGWIHISDHGSVDVSITESSLSISVKVEKDSQGHPTITTTGCSANIGKLKIDFHGGLSSKIYDVVVGLFTDKLKKSLPEQLCEKATDEINGSLNQKIESEPVVYKLGMAEIDYSLVDTPIFTPDYVESQHKGEFFLISDPEEAPFHPPPLPPIVSDDSKMLYVWLTDYIVNTASYVYWKAGIFNYNFTGDQVALAFLDTSYFEYLIPGLYSKYPDMKMKLELNATAPPNLTIVPGKAELRIPGSIIVYVLQPDQTAEVAFVMGAMVHANVSVFIHNDGTDQIVTANATLSKTELNLTSSNVGTFNISDLECSVNVLSQILVMPFINQYGNMGLPIPMFDGVSLVNSSIDFQEGHVVLGADVEYNAAVLDKQ